MRPERFQKMELLSGEKEFNVILTTYNIAFQKGDRHFLKKFNFGYLVLGRSRGKRFAHARRRGSEHQELAVRQVHRTEEPQLPIPPAADWVSPAEQHTGALGTPQLPDAKDVWGVQQEVVRGLAFPPVVLLNSPLRT